MQALPPTPPAIIAPMASGSAYIPLNEEINREVDAYRNGDMKAGQALLNRFQPIIKKYRMALWLGRIPEYDPDIGRFLCFFNRDKKAAAELLSKSVHRDEAEDLDQLLSLCLLETARKYNKISAGFKFVLKDMVSKMTRDASNHRTTMTFDFSDENMFQNKAKAQRNSSYYCDPLTNHLDTETEAERFVTEGSDLPGFELLNKEERRLAKMVFLDGIDRPAVAVELKLTDRQVRRKIGRIREKLRVGRPDL